MRRLSVEALPANSCAGYPSRFAGGQRTAVSLRSVSGQVRCRHRKSFAPSWSPNLLASLRRRKRGEAKCQRGRKKADLPRIQQRHNAWRAKAASCRASSAFSRLTAKNNPERQIHEWVSLIWGELRFPCKSGLWSCSRLTLPSRGRFPAYGLQATLMSNVRRHQIGRCVLRCELLVHRRTANMRAPAYRRSLVMKIRALLSMLTVSLLAGCGINPTRPAPSPAQQPLPLPSVVLHSV